MADNVITRSEIPPAIWEVLRDENLPDPTLPGLEESLEAACGIYADRYFAAADLEESRAIYCGTSARDPGGLTAGRPMFPVEWWMSVGSLPAETLDTLDFCQDHRPDRRLQDYLTVEAITYKTDQPDRLDARNAVRGLSSIAARQGSLDPFSRLVLFSGEYEDETFAGWLEEGMYGIAAGLIEADPVLPAEPHLQPAPLEALSYLRTHAGKPEVRERAERTILDLCFLGANGVFDNFATWDSTCDSDPAADETQRWPE